jgi:hypothetical protein
MTGKLKANSTFTIRGRGLVVDGELIEGIARVGMKVRVPSWLKELTISGVEPAYRRDRKPDEPVLYGFLFDCQDEQEHLRWQALDLKDQVLEIHD